MHLLYPTGRLVGHVVGHDGAVEARSRSQVAAVGSGTARAGPIIHEDDAVTVSTSGNE